MKIRFDKRFKFFILSHTEEVKKREWRLISPVQKSFYDPDRFSAVRGKIQISETLVVSWIVMALITGLCIWLTRDLKIRNISKRQAVAEMIVETANKFVIGNMGEKFRYLIPFVSALFATSVVSNLISLIGLRSPTADLSTEAAWAVVVFIMITTQKIKPTVLADI